MKRLFFQAGLEVSKGNLRRVKSVYELSNSVGLMKCSDGIVRRIAIRFLHGELKEYFDCYIH